MTDNGTTSTQQDEPSDETEPADAATPSSGGWRRWHAEVGSTAGVISTLIGLLQLRISMSAVAVALIVLMVGGTAAAMWGLVAAPSRIRTNLGWRLVLAITVLVGGSGSVLTVVRYATAGGERATAQPGASVSGSRSSTTAPRGDVVRPPQAICVTTSDGRQALIEILDQQRNALIVRVTVWEKTR